MRTNILKTLLIAIVGIFLSLTEISASNKKDTKKPSIPSKNNAPTPSKRIVPLSKIVYKKPTPTVKAVRTIPKGSVIIKIKGVDYHYSNGLYYRYSGGRYILVPAPRGAKVRALPLGFTILELMGRTYYYSQGAYYIQSSGGYQVVDAPQEVVVPTLPEDAEQITIEGKDYYIYDGCIYSIVITPDGKAFKKTGELDM